MTETPFTIIFYVRDVASSCSVYNRLFERHPVELSANFAMYELKSGGKFGLWARADVEPAVSSPGTNGELAFLVENKAKVDALFKRWKEERTTIAQNPTIMDFGYAFVALDPDGNRLRVFSFPEKA